MIVDIHNHVLPGLDDGAQSMEEAILLVRNAAEEGVTHIIATPHQNGMYTNDASRILKAVEELNREIANTNIAIEVLPGQEVHFFSCMDADKSGELVTLANKGKHILVELPDDHFPLFTYDVLFQLQLKGYTPILAHPERNRILRNRKQKLYELVAKGVLIQLSASTVVGKKGRSAKRYAEELMEHRLVHFISSDAHDPIDRPFALGKAYQHIRKRFSVDVEDYFKRNAKCVVEGDECKPLPPIDFA
ncbi:protein-tyrosine phosphatase [Sporosarcina luteola]|nr:protein-tyrosine phosphatase [Sporosarcina luteola]